MAENTVNVMMQLARERGVSREWLLGALGDALLAAYRRTAGAAEWARAEMDGDTGRFRVLALVLPEGERPRLLGEGGEEAEVDWSVYPEDDPRVVDVTPPDAGRIAAATARQVLSRRLRDVEDDRAYEEYSGRVGEAVVGTVLSPGPGAVTVDLGRAEGLLPARGQVAGERYRHGARIHAVIDEVQRTADGVLVILSRRSGRLVEELLRMEVPELERGLVAVRALAREPGVRTKVIVEALAPGVDAAGACIGPRGSRIHRVGVELGGERIDVLRAEAEPARLLARALAPAQVREVLLDDDARAATVVVPDDELPRAIGRSGVNARLAERLTGWRIEVIGESAHRAAAAAEEAQEGDEGAADVRCRATLASGRRCVNAPAAGSAYCGLHAQAQPGSRAA